jgi:hypothetical protein
MPFITASLIWKGFLTILGKRARCPPRTLPAGAQIRLPFAFRSAKNAFSSPRPQRAAKEVKIPPKRDHTAVSAPSLRLHRNNRTISLQNQPQTS